MSKAVRKVKHNGNGGGEGFGLGISLMLANPDEWREEEERLTKNDRVRARQKQANSHRPQLPTVDLGALGLLDPEKILLLKEFIQARKKKPGDKVIHGDNCGGLSGLLLCSTDLAELRQILRA